VDVEAKPALGCRARENNKNSSSVLNEYFEKNSLFFYTVLFHRNVDAGFVFLQNFSNILSLTHTLQSFPNGHSGFKIKKIVTRNNFLH
jgi:hypothetical protein